MNNTYFILSNKTIAIERLHICTWDFVSSKAAIELGMEFTINPTLKDVEFKLSLPFLQKVHVRFEDLYYLKHPLVILFPIYHQV